MAFFDEMQIKALIFNELSRVFRKRSLQVIAFCTFLTALVIIYFSLNLINVKQKPPKSSLIGLERLKTLRPATSGVVEEVAVLLYSPDANKSYNLSMKIPGDPILDETIKAAVHYKSRGYFVEVGAGDGQTRSLTLALEMGLKWTGLLLEADDEQAVALLNRNRKAYMSFECIGPMHFTFTGRFVSNGLLGSRLLLPNETGIGLKVRTKKCFPLESFLDALSFNEIDLLGVDINGNELSILRTLPWNKLKVKTIVTRYDGTEKDLFLYEAFLSLKSYVMATKIVGYDYLVFRKRVGQKGSDLLRSPLHR